MSLFDHCHMSASFRSVHNVPGALQKPRAVDARRLVFSLLMGLWDLYSSDNSTNSRKAFEISEVLSYQAKVASTSLSTSTCRTDLEACPGQSRGHPQRMRPLGRANRSLRYQSRQRIRASLSMDVSKAGCEFECMQ